MITVAPSILAANFARLGDEVQAAERGGAGRIHVDVMDGHFVPNLSMGPAIVKGLRPVTRLPLEVHLMVQDPVRFADAFITAGADSVIGHMEVLADPRRFIDQVRRNGKKIGLAVNPETAVEALDPFLGDIDLALCMTVHPGFGGQHFLEESIARIDDLRRRIAKRSPGCELEVDGGIDAQTAPRTVQAGANVLVAGTAIFGFPGGPIAGIEALQASLRLQG